MSCNSDLLNKLNGWPHTRWPRQFTWIGHPLGAPPLPEYTSKSTPYTQPVASDAKRLLLPTRSAEERDALPPRALTRGSITSGTPESSRVSEAISAFRGSSKSDRTEKQPLPNKFREDLTSRRGASPRNSGKANPGSYDPVWTYPHWRSNFGRARRRGDHGSTLPHEKTCKRTATREHPATRAPCRILGRKCPEQTSDRLNQLRKVGSEWRMFRANSTRERGYRFRQHRRQRSRFTSRGTDLGEDIFTRD